MDAYNKGYAQSTTYVHEITTPMQNNSIYLFKDPKMMKQKPKY